MDDPTHWNVDPDIGSLEFANPAEAKKATALFERVQKEAFIAGVSAAAFACEAAWANYRDEHGVYGSEVAALISGAIAAVKASR